MNRLTTDSRKNRLVEINQNLAELFSENPLDLLSGAEARRQDNLILCGLLGGKDVGKSTLINALIGQVVSIDRDVVGEGTGQPIVYLHEDEKDTFDSRVERVQSEATDFEYVMHNNEEGRKLVIIDLPDIDSTFQQHLTTVNTCIDYMDRVLWITTPHKGDDAATEKLARDVVRDCSNVYSVLNKCDNLLDDDFDGSTDSEIWNAWETQFEEITHSLGLRSDRERSFLLAAKYKNTEEIEKVVANQWGDPDWQKYGKIQPIVRNLAGHLNAEMNRLRGVILSPPSDEGVAIIKTRNIEAEQADNVRRLKDHYQILQRIGDAERAKEDIEVRFKNEFGDEYMDLVFKRLIRLGASDIEVAEKVLDRHIDAWPILRTIYWSNRKIVRWIGSRSIKYDPGNQDWSVEDKLRVDGRDVENRYEGFWRSIESLDLDNWLAPSQPSDTSARHAEKVEGRVRDRATVWDDEFVSLCDHGPVRFTWLRKSGLWFLLLWFPLVQPILMGLLEMAAAQGASPKFHGALVIVRSLSAGALLQGMAASGILFLLILAIMFSRSVSHVRRQRAAGNPILENTDCRFTDIQSIFRKTILAPVLVSVKDKLHRLRIIKQELDTMCGKSSEV